MLKDHFMTKDNEDVYMKLFINELLHELDEMEDVTLDEFSPELYKFFERKLKIFVNNLKNDKEDEEDITPFVFRILKRIGIDVNKQDEKKD